MKRAKRKQNMDHIHLTGEKIIYMYAEEKILKYITFLRIDIPLNI